MLNENVRSLSKEELDQVSGGFAGCPVGWGGPVTMPQPIPIPPDRPRPVPIFPPFPPIFPPFPMPEPPTVMPWF